MYKAMKDGPKQPIEMKWFQEQGNHHTRTHTQPKTWSNSSFSLCFSRFVFVRADYLFCSVSFAFVVPSAFLCMCVNVYSFSFEMLMHYITLHFILRAVNLWDREWPECCLFVRKKGVFEWLILHFYSIPFHAIFAVRSPNIANKFFGTFYHTHVWDV